MSQFNGKWPSSENRLLKRQGLKFLYLLTFALVLAVLSIYYFRLGRQIEAHSHSQVNMAFELILDDLRERAGVLEQELTQFARNSLAGSLYVTQLLQQQIEQQKQEGTIREVKKLMPSLSSVANEIRKLGTEIAASEILVYNSQGSLLALYRGTFSKMISGVYLPTISEQTFIPLGPNENWFLDLQALDELPQQTLPDGLLRLYQGTLPESFDVNISTFDGELALELIVPIMDRKHVEGLYVCYIELSQHDAERYSRVSQTRVNLFSDSHLSAGTLPEYSSIAEESVKQLQSFDVYESSERPQVRFSKVTIAGKHYYQGLLSLGNRQTPFVGTIAVQYPRYLDERRQEEFSILILAVMLLFGFLYKDIRRAEKIEELHHELKTRAIELEDTNRQLTSEIRERENMEQALYSAKEAAETANRAKSQFLANMSHELRTPLNAILGYAQILRDTSTSSELQQRGLTTIYQSGEHLLNLISEILDLAKIEAGRMELQEQACPLFEFLGSLTDMVRIRARQKHIHFNYEYDAALPAGVFVDTKRLRQVLLNLLGNAVKMTEQGSVTFRVTRVANEEHDSVLDAAFRQTPNDDSSDSDRDVQYSTMLFEVEDTGAGIPSERLQEIFSPFHQLPEHRTLIQGTGLGLTISQKLVEMLGGDIKVRSAIGEGSSFSFALRLREAETIQHVKELPRRRIIGYRGPRRSLLVVDDIAGNRAILKDTLTPLGFQVAEAEDGQKGLRMALEISPDLILLDLVMPKMDGFELARRIRQSEAIQQTPLIAISAHVFDEVREQCLEAGCDDFITKPFQMKHLFELLEQHLQLEWLYEAREAFNTHEDSGSGTNFLQALKDLPDERRQALLEQVQRGDLKGILKELEHIETLGEQIQPFVAELRSLAQGFQIDRILKRLSLED